MPDPRRLRKSPYWRQWPTSNWPYRVVVAAVWLAAVCPLAATAGTAIVAVATNFSDACNAIVERFEAKGQHRVKLAFGATGKLYAQINAGAPFDAFLSADQDRAARLIRDRYAVSGSSFTYARGQLTLWSSDPTRIVGNDTSKIAATLASMRIRALALANPALAPYGVAARQVLENLELWQPLRSRIVMGENIGQAFALVATGNAEAGFIARSLLMSARGRVLAGSVWHVPNHLHAPIRQDAVLLKRGASNTAAKAFLAYLRSDAARQIIQQFGYQVRSEPQELK